MARKIRCFMCGETMKRINDKMVQCPKCGSMTTSSINYTKIIKGVKKDGRVENN